MGGAAGIEELGVLYNVLGSKYTLGGDLELAEAPSMRCTLPPVWLHEQHAMW